MLLPVPPRYGIMLYASIQSSLENLVPKGEGGIIEAMCGVVA